MLDFQEPTGAQCTANALLAEDKHEAAYAIWYPQMGGYVGRAAVVIAKDNADCVDVFVWHNGEFPFGSEELPRHIHHCGPEQFVRFGRAVQRMQAAVHPNSKQQRKVAALTLDERDLLLIAKDGFKTAKRNKDSWFAAVNSCPHGPAVPGNGNVKAEAWYMGWWFFFHTVKPWADLLSRLSAQ